MQSRFFKQCCLPQKENTYLSSGNYNSLLPCLSFQNHFMFLNRGLHVYATDSLAEDEGELLFLFDTSSHKIFREKKNIFRRNAWTFMKLQESEVLSMIRHRGAPRRSLGNHRLNGDLRGAPLCLIIDSTSDSCDEIHARVAYDLAHVCIS